MRIEPYHRDLVPDGLDNSHFGEICEQISLVNPKIDLGVHIELETRGPFLFPPSYIFNKQLDAPKDVYGECHVELAMAVCDPVQTTLFLPDHAALIGRPGNAKLLAESTWHSEIFFSEWFRCDRTTGWNYRMDESFTPDVVDGLVANAYHHYYYQYFHWLFDSLSRVWHLQRFLSRRELRSVKWFVGNITSAFQRDSLAILDIDSSALLYFDTPRVISFPQAVNSAFSFKESIGTLRPGFTTGLYHVGWVSDYLEELRDRALHKTRALPRPGLGERIYVTRHDATHRRIVNQEEVRSLVAEYGFAEFCPGQHSLYEQIAAFKSARFILGTHGAGLANIIWSSGQASVAELMPENLNDVGYRFTANTLGQNHHILICQTIPHKLGIAYADIQVNLDALREMLEKMLDKG